MRTQSLSPFWDIFVNLSQKTNSLYGWFPAKGDTPAQPAGFLPLEQLVNGRFPLSGWAPIWILKAEDIVSLQKRGLLHLYGSFEKGLRELTVTCHYLDDDRVRALTHLLGPANGEAMQYMLSSGRTILAHLSDGVQGLKFCGTSVRRLEQKADRKMQPQKVKSTVRVNAEMPSRSVMREDRGFTLHLEDDGAPELTVLYRDYGSLEEKGASGRLLIPAFTLFSEMSEALRKTVFGTAEPNMKQWMSQNVVPFYARLIEDSYFNHGYHFEIHQQNIFFAIENGVTRDIFYQDSCDVLEDVAYRHWVLNKPAGLADLKRQAYIPGVGEYSRLKTNTFNSNISQWYRFFLRQFGLYEQSITVNMMRTQNKDYDFFAELAAYLRPSFFAHLEKRGWSARAKRYREYALVFEPRHDLFKMLNAFRDLMMKCSLEGRGEAVQFAERESVCASFGREPLANVQTYFTYGLDFATLSSLITSDDWDARRFDDTDGTQALILTHRHDSSQTHIVSRFALKGAICF